MQQENFFGDVRGLTLIELMIVLVLSLVLMAAVYLSYQVQQNTSHEQRQVAFLQQDLRAVTSMLIQDIRMAGCDPTQSGISPLSNAGENRVTLRYDSDNDGNAESFDYNWIKADNELQLNSETLAENVTTFWLEYFNENGAKQSSPGTGDNTKYITVNIKLEKTSGDNTFTREYSRRTRLMNYGK